MKRRFLLILLAACLGLTACQNQGQPAAEVPADTQKPVETTEPVQTTAEPAPQMPDIPEGTGLGINGLDAKLIAYLRANGLEQESFTLSPLSVKAALALTALGAEGETQRQILDALGFADAEQLKTWYASVLVGVADFDSRIFGEDKADTAYRVVNAIFHNTSCDGEFQTSYKEQVAKVLAAHAASYPAAEITDAVNQWVKEQTNGLIPSIVSDASDSAAVLVNALYLKTKWAESFGDSSLTDFTTVTGETVQKEFITKTEKFRYYEDDSCQLVVVPLQGGINMVLVLGDGTNLTEKLSKAEYRKAHVTLPKFEVESSFTEKELVKCLKAMGCVRMFEDGGVAEFNPMFTKEVFVDDIIHKAKVKVDEKGLEAAAATAVIMTRATAMPNPEEPVEFTADHPFQFAIIREDDAPELLFWGQICD
ncbi:MAG: hypothetical protein J5789_08200 [Oscillospiraceae bacterium]|nr:hypothetical protein [Oscillospiraceae bacterium]